MKAGDFAMRLARIAQGMGDRNRNRGKGFSRKAERALAKRARAAMILPRGKFIGYRMPDGSVACMKERYRSAEAAEHELKRIAEHSGKGYIPVRAYRCDWCNGYHLTSRA